MKPFPSRVLTASQQEDRARAILDHITFAVETVGGWGCVTRDGKRGVCKVMNTLALDLMDLRRSPA